MLDAPHPRILFQDVPNQTLLESLQALAGTSGVISGEATGIHASDWDLVVSFASVPYVQRNMQLLSFGGTTFPAHFTNNGIPVTLRRQGTLNARSVQVALDGRVNGLLQRSIVANDPGPGRWGALTGLPKDSIPLVTVGDEESPWAAMIAHPAGPLIYALPAETTHHVEWLAEALTTLHTIDPDRFPAEPDWKQAKDWATPGLVAAIEELTSIEDERRAALEAFDARESTARAAVATETASAGTGMQRLLTATGDDLVAVVKEVLTEFGFSCNDMDEHHDTTNGAKLEDLRAVSTDNQGRVWTGLVEVKGYSKGAKANDVGQIYGRPARAYLKETGRDADGLWHVVNVWREQNPSTRGEPFSGSNDLLLLEDNEGCAIDTRDLFRAWSDLRRGSVTADEVRASLMPARGRWRWSAR
jgi:hypothetical protein